MPIVTKNGDATAASRTANHGAIVAHIVNCKGKWGSGFVLALNKMSPIPVAAYRAWHKQSEGDIPLGDTQFVEVEPGKFVANMCAQRGVNRSNDSCLVDYSSLGRCLKVVFLRALRLGYAVHMPSGMGSGLAGGDKGKILDIIRTMMKKAESDSKFAKMVKEHTGVSLELDITLWDFDDTSAVSYVPAADEELGAAAPVESENQAEDASKELTAPADDIANL